MEFWGIEVKPGQTVKCEPGEDKYLHLSQASLGVTKKDKSSENVPVVVKFDNQKLVLGTLSGDNHPQVSYDLVFEKEFELSNSSKSTSIYFCGYQAAVAEEEPDFDQFSDSDSEDCLHPVPKANGKLDLKEQGKVGKTIADKAEVPSAKPKVKTVELEKVKPKAEEEDDESDDDDDDEDDESGEDESDDEDMPEAGDDSDDDVDDSSEEEDVTPKKAAIGKKRAADSASKTPVEKKAKLVSPAVGQKSGGDGKKSGHTATPHPAKKAGKTPASNNQSPKSGGGSVSCKSCSKAFKSEIALQAHSKAKHEVGK